MNTVRENDTIDRLSVANPRRTRLIAGGRGLHFERSHDAVIDLSEASSSTEA
jgi:hypothetical protein